MTLQMHVGNAVYDAINIAIDATYLRSCANVLRSKPPTTKNMMAPKAKGKAQKAAKAKPAGSGAGGGKKRKLDELSTDDVAPDNLGGSGTLFIDDLTNAVHYTIEREPRVDVSLFIEPLLSQRIISGLKCFRRRIAASVSFSRAHFADCVKCMLLLQVSEAMPVFGVGDL